MGVYPQDSEQNFTVNAVIFIGSVYLNINGYDHLMYNFLVPICSVILLTCSHFSLAYACIYIALPTSNY